MTQELQDKIATDMLLYLKKITSVKNIDHINVYTNDVKVYFTFDTVPYSFRYALNPISDNYIFDLDLKHLFGLKKIEYIYI